MGRIRSDWPRPEVRAQVLVEDAVVTGERLGSLKRERLQPVVRDLVEGAGSVPRIDVLAALKIGASPGRCVPRILDVGEGLGAPVALAVVIAVILRRSRATISGSPSSSLPVPGCCHGSHAPSGQVAPRRRSRSWCGLVEALVWSQSRRTSAGRRRRLGARERLGPRADIALRGTSRRSAVLTTRPTQAHQGRPA